METATWSEVQYKQAAVPELRTSEKRRRDSFASSRTADSGYNSDPDAALSPLDLLPPDDYLAQFNAPALLPPISSSAFDLPWNQRLKSDNASWLLANGIGITPKVQANLPSAVTSNPSTSNCSTGFKTSPNWTNPFKGFRDPLGKDLLKPPAVEGLVNSSYHEDRFDESAPACNTPKARLSSIASSISSTGSGGDYSVTDDSEYEELPDSNPSMLSTATLKTIELVLRKIEINLNYAAYIQRTGGQSARNQGSAEYPTGRRGSAQASNSKRKGRTDGSLPLDFEDEDGTSKRRRVSTTTTEDSENGPKFACPFYKHDPNRYRNRRTCSGPGWPTVHRMKEHLYRSHAQPIFCPRCYAMFDADTDLSNHLRNDLCHISAPQPIDGIDRETLRVLRKRSPPLRLEEDKWRDTYQMLFPDVPETDIPSPYYDGDSPTEESRRFRRALLQRIQQELFATAEHEGGAVEQNLLRQVAGIIHRCENELINSLLPATTHMDNAPVTTVTVPTPTPATSASNSFSVHGNEGQMPPEMAHRHMPSSNGAQQHIPEIPGQLPASAWDYPSEWIDWEAVFPPPPEAQDPGREESLPVFVTPVWT